MKRIILSLLLFVGVVFVVLAQDKLPAPQNRVTPQASAPILSTADRIALQSLEKAKADAQKQWNDSNEQELAILREWQLAHPGWHVFYNPQGDAKNFTIQSDEPKSKVEEKK
jgi:hypothetical protein